MKIVRTALSFLLLAALTSVAGAEDWPTRRLRVVVPFPAGGSGDVQVRVVADELAKALGQPVIVENKPGGSGGIAAVDVAHAPPDGYTLMVGSVGTHAINVSLYSKLQYDPVKDFAPLTLMTVFPQLIVPGVDFKGDTLAELIASLKADPGKASFGSSGIGSPTHLAGELFKTETGTSIAHVPYRGQGPAANDLLGGRLQVMFPSRSGHAGPDHGGQAARPRNHERGALEIASERADDNGTGMAQASQLVLGRPLYHGWHAAAGSRPAQSRAGADREIPRLRRAG